MEDGYCLAYVWIEVQTRTIVRHWRKLWQDVKSILLEGNIDSSNEIISNDNAPLDTCKL